VKKTDERFFARRLKARFWKESLYRTDSNAGNGQGSARGLSPASTPLDGSKRIRSSSMTPCESCGRTCRSPTSAIPWATSVSYGLESFVCSSPGQVKPCD